MSDTSALHRGMGIFSRTKSKSAVTEQARVVGGDPSHRGGQWAETERPGGGVGNLAADEAPAPRRSREEEAIANGARIRAVVTDPDADSAALTSAYLRQGGLRWEDRPSLIRAIAEHPNTPGVVKRAIVLDDGAEPEVRKALTRTYGLRLGQDHTPKYEPEHAAARESITAEKVDPGDLTTVARSGLLHPDDVIKAVRGQDPTLMGRLRIISWAGSYPQPTRRVVEAVLDSPGAESSGIARNPHLTASNQTVIAQHSPALAEQVVRGMNVDRSVLEQVACDDREGYEKASDDAMRRLLGQRLEH